MCIGTLDPMLPRPVRLAEVPVWFNGWRESVTVQVSRPLDRVVVAHLAHVPLAWRPFRAEMGLWPSGNAVCLWSCEAVS